RAFSAALRQLARARTHASLGADAAAALAAASEPALRGAASEPALRDSFSVAAITAGGAVAADVEVVAAAARLLRSTRDVGACTVVGRVAGALSALATESSSSAGGPIFSRATGALPPGAGARSAAASSAAVRT